MAANTAPIYTATPAIGWSQGYCTALNATADLTSGTIYLICTAGANGSFSRALRFKATPAGNTTATVARIWINNGSTTTTATNNTLFGEISLPLVTASATAAQTDFEYPMNLPLPAGYKIYITLGTASANGWAVSCLGGDY